MQTQRVNVIDQDDSAVYLGELTKKELARICILNDGNAWYQELIINGENINLKLDTGAQVNVMPEKELHRMKIKPVVKRTNQPVVDYCDNEVPIIGECHLLCATNEKQ